MLGTELLSDFINKNWKKRIEKMSVAEVKAFTDEMRNLFKSACDHEIATFNTGLYPPVQPNPALPVYQIITQSSTSRIIKSATSIVGGDSHLIGVDAAGAVLSVTIEKSKSAEDNQKVKRYYFQLWS